MSVNGELCSIRSREEILTAKLDLTTLLILVAADKLLVGVAYLLGLLDAHGAEGSAGDDGSLTGLRASGSHSGEDDSGDHGIHFQGGLSGEVG
jgi:hypothetical protein